MNLLVFKIMFCNEAFSICARSCVRSRCKMVKNHIGLKLFLKRAKSFLKNALHTFLSVKSLKMHLITTINMNLIKSTEGRGQQNY